MCRQARSVKHWCVFLFIFLQLLCSLNTSSTMMKGTDLSVCRPAGRALHTHGGQGRPGTRTRTHTHTHTHTSVPRQNTSSSIGRIIQNATHSHIRRLASEYVFARKSREAGSAEVTAGARTRTCARPNCEQRPPAVRARVNYTRSLWRG